MSSKGKQGGEQQQLSNSLTLSQSSLTTELYRMSLFFVRFFDQCRGCLLDVVVRAVARCGCFMPLHSTLHGVLFGSPVFMLSSMLICLHGTFLKHVWSAETQSICGEDRPSLFRTKEKEAEGWLFTGLTIIG
jgi:hypothetical protein